ncbi:MAG: VWA domain-containing protein [Flavobacteriales bacterium]|nr:VWA domain-containing protein [Flavobacteriales bacterium]
MKNRLLTYLFLALGIICSSSLRAQETTRILFVFDASNSMNAYWGGERKINTAVRLLGASLEDLYGMEHVQLGLRVYGHQTKHIPGQQDCDDTELVVPISKGNNLVIKKALENITPQGTTPIARSLERAADDFASADGRNIIILITDGIEACDEDPCAVSRALQSKNIIVKPFIIGIGIDDKYKSTFDCVGNYFDVSDDKMFEQVLDIVISQALNNTSVQLNLNDIFGKATETDLPFTLYDSNTGELKYHFVHTMNSKGLPDTLNIDPLLPYDLIVDTWPPLSKKGIQLLPGQHNVIDLDAGQGVLELKMSGFKGAYDDLKCIIQKSGSCEKVHVQDFHTMEKYLIGTYDLEILSVPSIFMKDVKIQQSEQTTIEIPAPGSVLIQTGGSGYGGIYLLDGNKRTCLIRFDEGNPSGKYVLQPGNYVVVFRSFSARQTAYTLEKEFTINSGSSTNIRLN